MINILQMMFFSETYLWTFIIAKPKGGFGNIDQTNNKCEYVMQISPAERTFRSKTMHVARVLSGSAVLIIMPMWLGTLFHVIVEKWNCCVSERRKHHAGS